MTRPPPGRPRAAGRLRRWTPALLWAAGLLAATSWPNPNVPRVEHADKVTHVALYAVLAFLAARAEPAASRTLRGGALVLAGGSAFGAFDEWHQQLVPGRSSSTGDWLADSLGAALGALAARRRRPEPSA